MKFILNGCDISFTAEAPEDITLKQLLKQSDGMERLTEKCWRNLDPWECCGQDKYCQRGCHDEGGCTNGCEVPKIYCKLAKYEDLEEQCIEENQCGLRELLTKWKAFFDDIAELYDYRKAEEQGLLLRLPCKVGDTVYYFSHRPFNLSVQANTIYEAKVVRIVTTSMGIQLIIQIHNEYGCTEIPDVRDFGKTVFLTREEAESALAEKGGAE